MKNLSIRKGQFFLGDEKYRVLSGAVHYFRTIPGYWEDRLLKLKACGLNTVETYVPWNLHEPEEGVFNFEGLADIERFLKTAAALGLNVILRPGPYICAEWDFGGFPYWLLKYKDMKLRCYDELYLEKVDAYFDVLIKKIVPYLSTNGGPVIAVQVENEYGSYGNDKKYLNYLKKGLIDRGVDVLLFTSDGPSDIMLNGGTIDGILKTANFGSDAKSAFENLRKHAPDSPLMCMEYWIGWFAAWGKELVERSARSGAETMEEMLALDGHVNIYMFHGGTNFGFYNGANWDEKYEPQTTSYDYDALLTEAGDLTPKYHAVKEVISKYKTIEPIEVKDTEKKAYGWLELEHVTDLMTSLKDLSGQPVLSPTPMSMESLGQDYGFVLYRTVLNHMDGQYDCRLFGLHDRAQVYVDGVYQGSVNKMNEEEMLKIEVTKDEAVLEILVENLGRTNYGRFIGTEKGITDGVLINNQYQFGWENYPISLNNLSALESTNVCKVDKPSVYKGTLYVDRCCDTFIDMKGWEKGNVFINGFNLGRFWHIGPLSTLYVPKYLLKDGENEVVVFSLRKNRQAKVRFVDGHRVIAGRFMDKFKGV